MKYKIQGIGLDTTEIKGEFKSFNEFQYMYTSITANNDFLIADTIKSFTEPYVPSLIVYVDFLDGLEEMLKHHLKTLGRNNVDLLLFDAKLDPGTVNSIIHKLKDSCGVRRVGIENPTTCEQIMGFMNQNKLTIDFVCTNVSPIEFSPEIIEFCRENEIVLIGKNIFGGHLSAARNIEAFSVPYLLSFAAFHCDIVFLSGRNLINSSEDYTFLKGRILDTVENEKIYTLKKSIKQLVSPLTQVVHTSVDLGGDFKIPYQDPEFSLLEGSDIITSLKGPVAEYNKDYISYDGQIYHDIKKLIETLKCPASWDTKMKFILARYKIQNYFSENYPDSSLVYANIGNSLFLINFEKPYTVKGGFFLWKRVIPGEERTFFLAKPREGEIIFREIEDEEKENDLEMKS